MSELLFTQFGKPTSGSAAAMIAGGQFPCAVASGDQGYYPTFNASVNDNKRSAAPSSQRVRNNQESLT
ncbi:MAG: hypothetical protein JO316_03360 [Abitibacteriaceae bacterium]|nr:hypothetical protein [Abditibacteriaceae bacterium]